MRHHELIVDVVLVILRIFLVLLVVGPFEGFARLFFFPLVVGIDLVVKPFLESETHTHTYTVFFRLPVNIRIKRYLSLNFR